MVASDESGVKKILPHEQEDYLYLWDTPYMLTYNVCKVFEAGVKAAARACALANHTQERMA